MHVRIHPGIFLIPFFFLAAPGCSSGGGSGANPSSTLPSSGIVGKVVDASGAGLADVQVRAGKATGTTAKDGTFQIDPGTTGEIVVAFEREGYLPTQKRSLLLDGSPTRLDVRMMPMGAAQTLDAEKGGSASAARGASLKIKPGSLVDASGETVVGEVAVHLTPLDPSKPEELEAYPGDLTARTQGGDELQLESFGVLDVTVRKDGKDLDIKPGTLLEIRIPAPSGVTSPPASMALWSFDPQRAVWVEEGVATYDEPTRTYLAEIGHLSPWNVDMPMALTCVRGTVEDRGGSRIPGAAVRSSGLDYRGSSSATTDASGAFCLGVRRSSRARITATHPAGGGVQRDIDTPNDLATLPLDCNKCEDIGLFQVEEGTLTGPGGESTSCKNVEVPLAGTCAQDMGNSLFCFDGSGACTWKFDPASGGIVIEYASGSKMVSRGDATPGPDGKQRTTVELFGNTGQLCATIEVAYEESSDNAEQKFTVPDGRSWTLKSTSEGETVIICPNGSQVNLNAESFDAYQACAGGGPQSSPTLRCTPASGGGGFPGSCTSDADCSKGQKCCNFDSVKVCAAPEACP